MERRTVAHGLDNAVRAEDEEAIVDSRRRKGLVQGCGGAPLSWANVQIIHGLQCLYVSAYVRVCVCV